MEADAPPSKKSLPWEQKAAVSCLLAVTALQVQDGVGSLLGLHVSFHGMDWTFLIVAGPILAMAVWSRTSLGAWLTVLTAAIFASLCLRETIDRLQWHSHVLGWPTESGPRFSLAWVVLRSVLLTAAPFFLMLGEIRRMMRAR